MRRLVLLICLAACGRHGFARIGADGGDTADSDAVDGAGPDVAFGDCWSAWFDGSLRLTAPQPVGELNTSVREGDPWLSPDALSMYFARANPTEGDLFVATRPDRYSPFGAAFPVTELNSVGDETKLSLTADGRRAVFSSNRQGSQGYDVWEATRAQPTDTFGPPSQTALGQVNDNLQQFDPHISGDGLRMYLAPLSGPNQFVELCTRTSLAASFIAPVSVDDLGTIRNGDPSLSPDERVIVYSGRQAAGDTLTLWYATRADPGAPFANARPLPDINDGSIHDQDPALSFDGCELYFSRQNPGPDLYVSVVR